MIVSLVAAVAQNGVIGRDGGLPWRLPDDLRHFRQLTLGHTVVMGRRTFEEVGQPLVGRHNVVISRNRGFAAPGVDVAGGLDEALAVAASAGQGAAEVFVIGGAQIYEDAMPRADRMYLTRVHGEPEGDTLFPPVPWGEWRLISSESHAADERHVFGFTIERWERRR